MPRPAKVNVKERFAAFLNNHSDPDLGITNEFVGAACKWICPQIARKMRGNDKRQVYFSGVFGSGSLGNAARKGKGKKISTYIINVENPQNAQSGHFIFIKNHSENKQDTFYMDSFGKDCRNSQVISLLSSSQYQYLCEPLQHIESSACGLYSMLYALAAEADMDLKNDFTFLPPKKVNGSLVGQKENDKRCIYYINDILSKYITQI